MTTIQSKPADCMCMYSVDFVLRKDILGNIIHISLEELLDYDDFCQDKWILNLLQLEKV